MNKKRKMTALLLLVVLLSGTLSACGGKADDTGSKSAGGQTVNVVDGKLEPAVTITTIKGEDPTLKFREGESLSDNVHTRWARDTLGVNIETLWSSPLADGSYNTKLKLMLSSGDKLPDVFVVYDTTIANMFIESGKVLNAGKAFEQYASPVWKAAMADAEVAWQPFIREGEKYGIPIIDNSMGSQPAMWIRQDWLDKLNLKAPTTVEELERVMEAFANQDPDGNAKKDTVALAFGMKDKISDYLIGDASWIYGMFGAIPERWYPGEDGKLQYGSIQPGAKTALGKLKEWKDKGYIANDVALHDINKMVELVAAGKVGIIGGQSWFMTYPGALGLASNPDAMFTPYPIPQGVNGESMRSVKDPYSGVILFNKDISNEALQAFFHYQNKMFSAYESNDPFIFKGYQDGYDYVIKDGKVLTDTADIPGGKIGTDKYTLTGGYSMYPSKKLEVDFKLAKGEELTDNDRAAMANFGIVTGEITPLDMTMRKALLVISEQTSSDVPNYFRGPTTSTMLSRNELLKKLQMDTYTEILYGKQPLDDFDAFVDKWKSSGGDDITKEVNEWYDSVK
ncbi:Lipoprotein LipO precursor [compost metagenome]